MWDQLFEMKQHLEDIKRDIRQEKQHDTAPYLKSHLSKASWRSLSYKGLGFQHESCINEAVYRYYHFPNNIIHDGRFPYKPNFQSSHQI